MDLTPAEAWIQLEPTAIDRQKSYSFALSNFKPVDPNAKDRSSIMWGENDKNANWSDLNKVKDDAFGDIFNDSKGSFHSGGDLHNKDEVFSSFEQSKDKPADGKDGNADVFANFGV